MIHVTSVTPPVGQAAAPADRGRTISARICVLRATGQSDDAIAKMLPAEYTGLTRDELAAAFALAIQMCPVTGGELVPVTPPGVPVTTTPPNGMVPPVVPGVVCPPCPPHEEHLPWWVWALIGFGTATGIGLIVYVSTRKKK